MPNLLIYAEARECLDQLRAAADCPASRKAHSLAYPEELFAELRPDSPAGSAYNELLDELFDGRLAPQPEYAY